MKQRQFRIVKMTTSHTKQVSYKVEELKKFLWFKPKWKVCVYKEYYECGVMYNTIFHSKEEAQTYINEQLDYVIERLVK